MQFELRTQVIEPQRKTFQHLIDRYGDRPASRYEEGTHRHPGDGQLPLPPAVGAGQGDLRPRLHGAEADRPLLLHRPAPVLLRALRHVAGRPARRVRLDAELPREARPVRPAPGGLARRLFAEVVLPLRHYEAGGPDDQRQRVPVRLRHHDHPVPRRTPPSTASATPSSSAGPASPSAAAPPTRSRRPSSAWLEDDALQPLRRLVEQTARRERLGRRHGHAST